MFGIQDPCVVDLILIALPISALADATFTYMTKPLLAEHDAYVFGGAKPKA